MDRIVRALFSAQSVWDDDVGAESAEGYPLFSIKALKQAVLSMKSKSPPGPDGIAAEVYKLVFQYRLDLLLGAFSACLKEGTFPAR